MATKIILSLLAACVIMGCASKPEQKQTGHAVWTEAAAMNTAKQWADATSKPDVIELEKILTEDYVHIHATALVENKQQFIDALKTGARKYDPIILEETKVRILGSTALVNGRFNLKAISGGRTIEGVNRFTLVLEYTGQGSRLPPSRPQPSPLPQGSQSTRGRNQNKRRDRKRQGRSRPCRLTEHLHSTPVTSLPRSSPRFRTWRKSGSASRTSRS